MKGITNSVWGVYRGYEVLIEATRFTVYEPDGKTTVHTSMPAVRAHIRYLRRTAKTSAGAS